jgi:hypothetical protein
LSIGLAEPATTGFAFLCPPTRLPTLLRCSCPPAGAASLAHAL